LPGEWLNYDNGSWTENGIPNPGRTEAWTIINGDDCPGGAVEGNKVYKGWILTDSTASHRAYPGIHCDYASPLVNSWWVYLDTDFANFPNGGWHHFGTWGNNPDWDVHTMSAIRTGKLEMAHVDSFEVLGDIDMPLRRWVRFTVYVEYAPAGKNLIFAWMDDKPVMSAKNIKPGGSNLMRAHWGLYTSGNLFEGIQYNDDIQIWGLSEPWTDFSRVPPSPYDTTIDIKENYTSKAPHIFKIKSFFSPKRMQIVVNTKASHIPTKLYIWDMTGTLINTCDPQKQNDTSILFEWNGKGLNRQTVSAGVYLLNMVAGDISINNKVSLYE
jgi:hypothetical protein